MQKWTEAHPQDTAIVYGFDDLWMSEHILDRLEAEAQKEAGPKQSVRAA